jgi:hypothetical protein
MDEVQVEVVEPKVAQVPLDGGADVLLGVVRVPQFGGDPQVFAAAGARRQCGADAGPDFGFVAVVEGAIQVPVARADRLLHQVRGRLPSDFPQTQPHDRHPVSASERQ